MSLKKQSKSCQKGPIQMLWCPEIGAMYWAVSLWPNKKVWTNFRSFYVQIWKVMDDRLDRTARAPLLLFAKLVTRNGSEPVIRAFFPTNYDESQLHIVKKYAFPFDLSKVQVAWLARCLLQCRVWAAYWQQKLLRLWLRARMGSTILATVWLKTTSTLPSRLYTAFWGTLTGHFAYFDFWAAFLCRLKAGINF